MIKFKDYRWALEGLTALILLITFVLMMVYGVTEVGKLVIRLTGLGLLFFTLVRIKPIISMRNEKDYILVMFSELLIFIIAGIMMLFFPDYVMQENNKVFSYSRLLGAVLFVRGITHFWTTAKRYELHDIISFIVHIIFISFGFLYLYNNNLSQEEIVIAIMVLSLLLCAFFVYRTYNGYHHYRIHKMNLLKMEDYMNKKEKQKQEKTIKDPESIESQINPKKIEDPDDERPSIDVQ